MFHYRFFWFTLFVLFCFRPRHWMKKLDTLLNRLKETVLVICGQDELSWITSVIACGATTTLLGATDNGINNVRIYSHHVDGD